MSPRSKPFLAAALFIASGAAGCLENLPDDLPFFSSGEEASLDDLKMIAEREARGWRANAVLDSASSFEFSESMREEVRSEWPTGPDPKIGNGRATGWLFQYVEPGSGDEIDILVAAQNKTIVLRQENEAGDSEDDRGDVKGLSWRLDSDEAARTAHANESFETAAANLADPAYVVVLSPGNHYDFNETAPQDKWVLWAWAVEESGDEKQMRSATAIINATTGEVVFAGAFPGFGWWGGGWNSSWGEGWSNWSEGWSNWSEGWSNWSSGWKGWAAWGNGTTSHDARHEGNLTVAMPEATHEFPVRGDDRWAEVAICWGQRIPGGSISLRVLDPDGNEVAELSSTGRGPDSETVPIPLEEGNVGDYAIEISLDPEPGNVASDYRLRVIVRTGVPGRDYYQPPGMGDFVNC